MLNGGVSRFNRRRDGGAPLREERATVFMGRRRLGGEGDGDGDKPSPALAIHRSIENRYFNTAALILLSNAVTAASSLVTSRIAR